MKPKIKYAVSVLRRTNKLWRFFFLYEENMQHINQFLTCRKINFLLWTKIRPNVKQISPWKKPASSLDSSKATIVSKALYNLKGSYGVIHEAFSSFLDFFLCLLTRIPT